MISATTSLGAFISMYRRGPLLTQATRRILPELQALEILASVLRKIHMNSLAAVHVQMQMVTLNRLLE
jgi:hypothetical protein